MGSSPRSGAKRVTVVGTGSWGTTLAIILARKGLPVSVYARSAEEVQELARLRENRRFLHGIKIPSSVAFTPHLAEALDDSQMVILAVPSQTMRANIRELREFLEPETLILSAAKGLEVSTLLRMSQVIGSELPSQLHRNVCALSGPNLAREIADGKPAATVVASKDMHAATRAQHVVRTPRLRVYTNCDIAGVELGGALKNVIAVGAGIADGLDLGDNAKAALMTRGLAEIARLGAAVGANPQTFSGLTGLGDLLATCASPFSRNRYVGQELAKGHKLKDIQAYMAHVAEGVFTTEAACQLSRKYGVEMPITEKMYEVLFEDKRAVEAIEDLMLREARHES